MQPSVVCEPVRIWDLPTRLFHVLLALLMAGMFITAKLGSAWMSVHFYMGYAIFALIVFRFLWGFLGGFWSQFVNFVPTPIALLRFLNVLPSHLTYKPAGHNPLGALSVITMLLAVKLQVLSGFFSDDEISSTGPWAVFASPEWVSSATNYHTEIGQPVLVGLIILHVVAIIFYKLVKKQPLLRSMVHGDKVLPIDTTPSEDTLKSRIFACVLFLLSASLVYLLVNIS